MAKKKQPYIPLYTGDYIKDTRSLSLAAKGAWSDIILFMWAQETNGIMEGTLEDFARLIGGTLEQTEKVLLELCSKKICDGGPGANGFYRIVCRRLVKEAAISAIRSESGSKGGSKSQAKGKANHQAKTEQKSDNDNDSDNGIEIKYGVEDEFRYELTDKTEPDENLPGFLVWEDEIYREHLQRLARSHHVTDLVNVLDRWEGWYVNKFDWRKKTLQEMRLSFEGWIKDPKSRNNDYGTGAKNKQQRNTSTLVAGFAARHGSDAGK